MNRQDLRKEGIYIEDIKTPDTNEVYNDSDIVVPIEIVEEYIDEIEVEIKDIKDILDKLLKNVY